MNVFMPDAKKIGLVSMLESIFCRNREQPKATKTYWGSVPTTNLVCVADTTILPLLPFSNL